MLALDLIRHMRLIALLCAVMLIAPLPLHADVISLKRSIRLPADRDAIRLADVASLEGAYAQSLSDIVLMKLADRGEKRELSVAEVRRALEAHEVNWGRLNLSGSDVLLRPSLIDVQGQPVAMQAVALNARTSKPRSASVAVEPTSINASSLESEHTVRGLIVRYIIEGIHVKSSDLRLTFETTDEAFLAAIPGTFRYEFRPLSKLWSDRIELQVRRWQHGRIQDDTTIRIHPTIRFDAVVPARDIARGERLVEADIDVQRQWLHPSHVATAATLIDAVGRIATFRLREGELLRTRHIRSDYLIRRGDQCTVRCLVGGVVISLQAEARDDGTEGDTIEFKKQGERQTFRALVTGPAEAVLDLSRQQQRVDSAQMTDIERNFSS